ncbi:CG12920 [Drosophila busckii]|uniref:CG12920 n=1 Tax=Drosophila busckii TaxID=30019 RepID=A0A0M4EEE9_DROBS|nr:CG12920 [Drosophila busckii]
MNKTTILYGAVLLVVYFTLVFCEESSDNVSTQLVNTNSDMNADELLNAGRDLLEFEGRTRRHRHRLWYRHLWPLAIAYWIKVKLVIVSFFVGSAIYLGLRYFWPHAKCNQEIILDHPQHDHIPYSLDPHIHEHEHEHYDSPGSFDTSGSSFDPYSGYSSYASSDIVSDVSSTGPGTGPPNTLRRGKRSVENEEEVDEATVDEVELVDEEITESVARQQPAEEQIADFLFAFLGLDSKACRRRFVCEMEFRSKLNPLSSMAFRIVGRGFFEKYTNANNPNGRATNFFECATANPECVFVENAEPESAEPSATEVTEAVTSEPEAQNELNLQAERRHAKIKHRRGDRMLLPIAERILTQ